MSSLKTCPHCGAQTFEDMDTCYVCMYDYTIERMLAQVDARVIEAITADPLATVLVKLEPPAAPPSLALRVTHIDAAGVLGKERAFDLPEGEEFLIGRDADCGLVLFDPTVSRRHARLVFTNGELALDDLQSKNGTLCQGEPITGPEVLAPGDIVKLGNICLQLSW